MSKAIIEGKTFEITEDDNVTYINGKPANADIFEYRNGKFHVLLDNKSYTAEILSSDAVTKTVEVKVNNSVMTVMIKDRFDELLSKMGIDISKNLKVNDIKAPMPGMVLQVMVESGQPIKKGDAIVVLEAMKMENILKSPADGIVKKIHVSKGDKVEKNQVMVHLD